MKGAEYDELTAFLAVADARSFRRAAQRLGVSPSALSRSIRSLEERLGATLLNRTTRSVSPTDAGRALVDRLRPAMAAMDQVVIDVGGEARGVVRLNLPRLAARMVVAPILADFRRAHPHVRLELVIDDHLRDVVSEGFDAGIRSGGLVHEDMIAVRLTPDLRMAVVGSPPYFADHPPPDSPGELRDHACVAYRWNETGAVQPFHFEGPEGPFDVAVESVVTVNETDLLLDAALRGVGLAFLAEQQVAPHLASGALVRVLESWCRPFSGLHLYYYPRRAHMPAAMRAFVDFVRLPKTVKGG